MRAASVLLVAFSLGCFFELGDVVPEEPLPNLGGNGGAAGAGEGGTSVGGEAGTGATGGAQTDPGCAPGQKRCDGVCVASSIDNGCGDPACVPCALLPEATSSCNSDTGACQLDQCNVGFADCDGEAQNGCEYPFGPGGELRGPTALLEVPEAHINIADGGRDDWGGVPAYRLEQPCTDCVDRSLPDVTARNEVPSRRDLDAYFRIAWDRDFLYVLGDVFDANIVANGVDSDFGQCQNGSICEDGLALFTDGRNDRVNSPQRNVDDLYVFVGLGGAAFRISGAPVSPTELDFKATVHAPQCYRVEARLTWAYVTGVQNGQPVAGIFPALPGQEYGFDVSVNDWDPGVSDPAPQRESQLFWVNPGDGYQQVTSGLGPMRLVEGAAVNPPPQ